NLDTNKDGQVSLAEWRKGGKKKADFRKHDLNGDGFITAAEILRTAKKDDHLELENDRVEHKVTLDPPKNEQYQGKRAFKIFTIKFEQGKSYQIELASQFFLAHLYLEGPERDLLTQTNNWAWGRASRITHRATKTGIYRIVATSQGGFAAGACTLTVTL